MWLFYWLDWVLMNFGSILVSFSNLVSLKRVCEDEDDVGMKEVDEILLLKCL